MTGGGNDRDRFSDSVAPVYALAGGDSPSHRVGALRSAAELRSRGGAARTNARQLGLRQAVGPRRSGQRLKLADHSRRLGIASSNDTGGAPSFVPIPQDLMPASDVQPYNLSFTAASLRPELCRIVAELYLTCGSWSEAKQHALASNLLQSRSASSGVRLEREIRQRLQTLTHAQLSILATSTAEDRAAISWLAAMKQHAFLFEFASEVLRDKLAARESVLRPSDYERFLENRELTHPELRELTPSSSTKVRNVTLRMLTEAGLLVEGPSLGSVQRPVISPAVRDAIRDDAATLLAGFLFPDEEIARL